MIFIVISRKLTIIIVGIIRFDRFVQTVRQVKHMESRVDRIWNGITRAARRLRGDRRGAIFLFRPMRATRGIARSCWRCQ